MATGYAWPPPVIHDPSSACWAARIIQSLDHGPDRLRRHVLGQDLLLRRPGAERARQPAGARERGDAAGRAARTRKARRLSPTSIRLAGRDGSGSVMAVRSSLCRRAWNEPRNAPAAPRGRGSPGTSPSPAACAACLVVGARQTLLAGHRDLPDRDDRAELDPAQPGQPLGPRFARRRSPSRRPPPGACRSPRGRTGPGPSWG